MTAGLKDISEIGVPKAQGESWADAADRLQTEMNENIDGALKDLDRVADLLRQDGDEFDALMIEACVETLREELGE